MSRISELFSYLLECPQFAALWGDAAAENCGDGTILPQGSSEMVTYNENTDVYGNYECEIVPNPSVYEDYRINCYTVSGSTDESASESSINIINLDDVQKICDWIAGQNTNGNLPTITGLNVVSVECRPFVPQIEYLGAENKTAAYFITIRLRYVNTAKIRCISYSCEN